MKNKKNQRGLADWMYEKDIESWRELSNLLEGKDNTIEQYIKIEKAIDVTKIDNTEYRSLLWFHDKVTLAQEKSGGLFYKKNVSELFFSVYCWQVAGRFSRKLEATYAQKISFESQYYDQPKLSDVVKYLFDYVNYLNKDFVSEADRTGKSLSYRRLILAKVHQQEECLKMLDELLKYAEQKKVSLSGINITIQKLKETFTHVRGEKFYEVAEKISGQHTISEESKDEDEGLRAVPKRHKDYLPAYVERMKKYSKLEIFIPKNHSDIENRLKELKEEPIGFVVQLPNGHRMPILAIRKPVDKNTNKNGLYLLQIDSLGSMPFPFHFNKNFTQKNNITIFTSPFQRQQTTVGCEEDSLKLLQYLAEMRAADLIDFLENSKNVVSKDEFMLLLKKDTGLGKVVGSNHMEHENEQHALYCKRFGIVDCQPEHKVLLKFPTPKILKRIAYAPTLQYMAANYPEQFRHQYKENKTVAKKIYEEAAGRADIPADKLPKDVESWLKDPQNYPDVVGKSFIERHDKWQSELNTGGIS